MIGACSGWTPKRWWSPANAPRRPGRRARRTSDLTPRSPMAGSSACAAPPRMSCRRWGSTSARPHRQSCWPNGGSPVAPRIIGSGPVAHQLITRVRQVPDYGLNPVVLLNDRPPPVADPSDIPYYGTSDNLVAAAHLTAAEELIVAPSSASDEQLARTAQLAQTLGIRVRVVPRLRDAVGGGTPWSDLLQSGARRT